MKKILLFLVALTVAFGFAANADAARHGKGKGHGKDMKEGCGMMGGMAMGDEGQMMRGLAALGLDDKQKEAARAVHLKMKKEHIRRRADMEIAEVELRELLVKDPVDLKAAEAKLKQIEGLRTDLHFSHVKAHEEIKALLTPDQKNKLRTMMMEKGSMGMMGGMGMGMMGHGMGMGGGMMKCGCGMMGGMGQADPDDAPQAEGQDTPPSAGHQH